MNYYDRTLAYRAERGRLIEQANEQLSMAACIREVEEEEAAKAAKLAAQNQGDNVYIFAPKDQAGRPLVTPFEIRYTTNEDLTEKLRIETANVKFILNREKLGNIPETAPRFQEEFNSDAGTARVKRDVDEFIATTPEYYSCPANFNQLIAFIEGHRLAPTLDNIRLAFKKLTSTGILIGPNGAPLKPNTSGDRSGISYTLPNGRVLYGKNAVEAMPPEEMKRRCFHVNGFVEAVDRLYAK
jgi:hypothetical protein